MGRSCRRRKGRKVFSDRQKAAIIRISQAPVETKANPTTTSLVDYLNATGFVSPGSSHAFQVNIFAPIPTNQGSNPAPDDHTFIGNDLQSRGFRWEGWFWSGDGVSIPGGNYDVWFRLTVFEVPSFTLLSQITPSAINFDPDYPGDPIVSKWNMDYVKVRFQKTFKLDNNGSMNAMTHKKFYIPIGRKIEKAVELADSALIMGEIKGLQVYWALEYFAPGLSSDFRNFTKGRINTTLYFKDA